MTGNNFSWIDYKVRQFILLLRFPVRESIESFFWLKNGSK
jgi:hypothetical protein